MDGGDASGKSIFDLPKHAPAQIDIMFHQPHPAIFRPALSVVVPHNVLVIWVWVLGEESLDEFSCFIVCELKEDIQVIDVPEVDPDGMSCFDFNALVDHELIFIQGRTCNFISPIEPHDEDIDDESIKLEDERSELQSHQ